MFEGLETTELLLKRALLALDELADKGVVPETPIHASFELTHGSLAEFAVSRALCVDVRDSMR